MIFYQSWCFKRNVYEVILMFSAITYFALLWACWTLCSSWSLEGGSWGKGQRGKHPLHCASLLPDSYGVSSCWRLQGQTSSWRWSRRSSSAPRSPCGTRTLAAFHSLAWWRWGITGGWERDGSRASWLWEGVEFRSV